MPRAKSSSGSKSKKIDGGGTKSTGRKSKDTSVVDVDEGSDNDEADGEVEQSETTEHLPVAPKSTQALRKLIIAPKDIRTHGWENIEECQIKHPKSGKKSLFLLDTGSSRCDGNLLFEVLSMQHDTRSWFVDNTVISDGNMYLCTPVDPLFFVIPVMEKSSKAKPLIDHLIEGSLPKAVAEVLTKRLSHKQLEFVSIKKDFEDFVVFLYSEEKTLNWLAGKAERVGKFLMDKGISQAESSVSSNFVKSSVEALSKEDCLRYACDIVGEYIDETLKKKLLEKLGLPVLQEKAGTKRKSSLGDDDENINKKTKISGDDPVMPLEDYGSSNSNTPVNKNVKVTAKEKELQKAAQGSHSLFKFFAPKAK